MLRIEQLTWRTSIRFGLMLLIFPLAETTSGVAPKDTPGAINDPAAVKTTILDSSCDTL